MCLEIRKGLYNSHVLAVIRRLKLHLYDVSLLATATTRKLYEKKLLKLMEQGPELKSSMPLPMISSTTENTRQNGSNDSDQYSDNEEGKAEVELACELFKLYMNNTRSRRNI